MLKKNGMLGHKKITYFEDEVEGEYTFIEGDWIFTKKKSL